MRKSSAKRRLIPWMGTTLPPALTGTISLLRLLPSISLRMTVWLTLSMVATTVLPLGFIVVSGLLVGSIPNAVRQGVGSAAGHHTVVLLAAAAGIIVLQRVLAPFQLALATVFGRRVDRRLQERVISAVGRPTGIRHLEDPAILNRIASTQDVGGQGYHPGDAVEALASLIPSWLLALGGAAILIPFRWWLGIGWILVWPIVLYYLQREYIRVGETAGGEAATLRRAGYYRDLALTPPAAKELRIWGLTGWLVERYQHSWLTAMAPIWRARSPGRVLLWASAGTVAAANMLTFGLLAWSGVHGQITLGALAVYIQAATTASMFRAFDDQNMTLAYAAVSVPNLLALEHELVDGDTSPTQLSGADRIPAGGQAIAGDIALQKLSFRYAGREEDTVHELDLDIPAGRSLAIVGANGAGKTTLVKLLCRLYEPTDGQIAVAGHDLGTIAPGQWRHHVAAIFQDFTHYHLSVRENIALGAPHISNNTERLREAARKAGALELIEALPRGWDTVLSRQYADGTDLSGGQWQRIALARALFAVEGEARLLILDEPTANLDVRAEAEIYDRFLDLTAGLTTILISHRFATVRRTDRIVVLEGAVSPSRARMTH